MSKNVAGKIERFSSNSDAKRMILMIVADRKRRCRLFLTLTSGGLSLISATLLSAVLTDVLSSFASQLLALVCAFLGGVCAILVSVLFRESEMQLLYRGASDFLALREQADALHTEHASSGKPHLRRLAELRDSYVKCSSTYDHLIPYRSVFGYGLYQLIVRCDMPSTGETDVKNTEGESSTT